MKTINYLSLLILAFTQIGCISLQPPEPKIIKSYDKELNKSTFKKDFTIYGNTDPKLKITLIAEFEASELKKDCYNISNGWGSFRKFLASTSSYGKSNFELYVPLKWEESLGTNDCGFELYGVTLQISMPPQSYVPPLDLLLVADNESDYKLLGKNIFDHDRDYKVRYLTGLSFINCTNKANEKNNPQLVCKSNLDISNIKKDDIPPSKLGYGVNIILSK